MIAGFASVAVVSEPNLFAFKYKALFVLPFRYPASSVPKPVRLSWANTKYALEILPELSVILSSILFSSPEYK